MKRREFLKLSGMTAASLLFHPNNIISPVNDILPMPNSRNIIMILYDTLSARHLSLHGYPRNTSPNLGRFAQKATVYHQHHVAANFTTPSTASLFTGSYPFSHRAFNLSGLIAPWVRPTNLFTGLKQLGYRQVVFTHNLFADMLLYLFDENVDEHVPLDRYTLAGRTFYNHLFPGDAVNALKSYDQHLFKREEAHGSLFLSLLNDISTLWEAEFYKHRLKDIHSDQLPRLANTDLYFLFRQVTDGVIQILDKAAVQSSKDGKPFFTYIHLLPPHAPYTPTNDFLGLFKDNWTPAVKKRHRLSTRLSEERINQTRQVYDEYIANVDAEFGRILDFLQNSGLMKNSYVIFTSDHGEMFERGVIGHSTPLVFEELIHVPLVISSPGQVERRDIDEFTSNVDLMATLLEGINSAVTTHEGFDTAGEILPGFQGAPPSNRRSIYVVEAKRNDAFKPLNKATVALLRDPYKLVYYSGYREVSRRADSSDGLYELYDLRADPEEMTNLYPDHPASGELKAELDERIRIEDEQMRRQIIQASSGISSGRQFT